MVLSPGTKHTKTKYALNLFPVFIESMATVIGNQLMLLAVMMLSECHRQPAHALSSDDVERVVKFVKTMESCCLVEFLGIIGLIYSFYHRTQPSCECGRNTVHHLYH